MNGWELMKPQGMAHRGNLPGSAPTPGAEEREQERTGQNEALGVRRCRVHRPPATWRERCSPQAGGPGPYSSHLGDGATP